VAGDGRGEGRDHEHGVGEPGAVGLAPQVGVAGLARPEVAGPEPCECHDLGRQGVGPAAALAQADDPAPQRREVLGDLRVDLLLDEQVQRLDVQARDLAEVRPAGEVEAPLDEGDVEPAGVQLAERLVRAGRLDQLDGDRPPRGLASQRVGDPMALPRRPPGGHPQPDRPGLRLVQRDVGREADGRQADQREPPVAGRLPESSPPRHRNPAPRVVLGRAGRIEARPGPPKSIAGRAPA